MQIANRFLESFIFIILVQIALAFEFALPNALGFVPMNFSKSNLTIGQANRSNAFQFTPTALSVLLMQTSNITNRIAYSNNLNVSDVAKDLKIHEKILACWETDCKHELGVKDVHR